MGIELIKKTSKYIDEYVVFDDVVYPKKEIPDEVLEEYAMPRQNYISPQYQLISNHGQILVSDQVLHYFGQHLYYPARSVTELNANEQWLSAKKGLNDEVYAGYRYTTGEDHYLNKITIMRRLGSYQAPGRLGPSPKHIKVQCIPTNKSDWEDLSEVKLPILNFLANGDIDYGTAIDIPAKAFRVVIDEWYPGVEDDMFLGLYRLFFITTPANYIRLPKLETFNDDYVYAYKKTKYPTTTIITPPQELLLPSPATANTNTTPSQQQTTLPAAQAYKNSIRLITPYTNNQVHDLRNTEESLLKVVCPDDYNNTITIELKAPHDGVIYLDLTDTTSIVQIQIQLQNKKKRTIKLNTILTKGILIHLKDDELKEKILIKRK